MNDCKPATNEADTSELRKGLAIAPRLIPIEHVAAYIGVSVPTAERMHACDEMPLPVTFPGRRVLLWDIREIDAWLDRRKPNNHTYTRNEWIAVKATANRRA